jgi:hypothetical protein
MPSGFAALLKSDFDAFKVAYLNEDPGLYRAAKDYHEYMNKEILPLLKELKILEAKELDAARTLIKTNEQGTDNFLKGEAIIKKIKRLTTMVDEKYEQLNRKHNRDLFKHVATIHRLHDLEDLLLSNQERRRIKNTKTIGEKERAKFIDLLNCEWNPF